MHVHREGDRRERPHMHTHSDVSFPWSGARMQVHGGHAYRERRASVPLARLRATMTRRGLMRPGHARART